MDLISPRYQMKLADEVEKTIWTLFPSYKAALMYILKWHEENRERTWENFSIIYKDKNQNNIDLYSTVHSIDGELLIKIAIDLEIETPDFIPAIPKFRNTLKCNYKPALRSFEKAFKSVEEDPSTAIGLANSTLESIVKEILNNPQIKTKWDSKDTLYTLTKALLKELHLYPTKSLPVEIRNIGSSLLSISQTIERLRSEKTEFHGKTLTDEIITDSAFAYLCINAVGTVGLFLHSYYKKNFATSNERSHLEIDTDDLPNYY